MSRLTRGRVDRRFVDRDRHGRFMGRCWSDASPDLNAALIRSGPPYRRYSKGPYAKAEAEACRAGRGTWKWP